MQTGNTRLTNLTAGYIVNSIISIGIMIGFKYVIVPTEPLTPLGVEIIGIFLGIVYGWLIVGDIFWPSIFGMIFMGLSDWSTVAGVFKTGFGHAPPEPPTPPEPPIGWEFEAEVDTDQGRFFAGAGPKQQRDIIYGFGYDKSKGGFFTQWGEWKGGPQPGSGPRFEGQDASMEANQDGSYSVGALKDLRGIVVQTVAGDVTIHANQAPDAGVVIDGDVDDLDVTCSADGVLTIREGRTASSSFFSRRGFGSADVELYLPCRFWELLNIATTSGDVELDGEGLDVNQLAVNTASGDLSCHLRACRELRFHSASGDLELFGDCADLHADTMSGDITLHGQVDDAMVKTASGDIETDGAVARFLGKSMSGDLHVESSKQPQVMELSTKSGDCQARIPDAGPFTLRYKTVSGEADFAFPFRYQGGAAVYGDGSGPCYSMTTVSGDLSLERY